MNRLERFPQPEENNEAGGEQEIAHQTELRGLRGQMYQLTADIYGRKADALSLSELKDKQIALEKTKAEYAGIATDVDLEQAENLRRERRSLFHKWRISASERSGVHQAFEEKLNAVNQALYGEDFTTSDKSGWPQA